MCNRNNSAQLNAASGIPVPNGPGSWALIPFRPRINEQQDDEEGATRRAILARRGRASLRNPLNIPRVPNSASGLNIPT